MFTALVAADRRGSRCARHAQAVGHGGSNLGLMRFSGLFGIGRMATGQIQEYLEVMCALQYPNMASNRASRILMEKLVAAHMVHQSGDPYAPSIPPTIALVPYSPAPFEPILLNGDLDE